MKERVHRLEQPIAFGAVTKREAVFGDERVLIEERTETYANGREVLVAYVSTMGPVEAGECGR